MPASRHLSIYSARYTMGNEMHKRPGAVLVIVISGLCACLLWASERPAGRLGLSSLPWDSGPAGATASEMPGTATTAIARLRADSARPWPGAMSSANRIGVASPLSKPMSLSPQSYSMAAPEFISDPAAAAARSIAVGDVSGDGRDDLAFLSVHWAPNPVDIGMELYVANQRSDGRLDAAVKIAEWDYEFAYQLLIADLDHDGVGEIITTAANSVMVLHSNADGTFTSSTILAGDPHDLTVTDVNRDGHLDILVDSSNTTATVLYGDGYGGIATTSTIPVPASAVRTTGDVTGDGLDDLILATIYNRPLQEFWIYRALVSGGYAAPLILSRPIDANQTASLAVGDFNSDGRGDLALHEAKDGANVQMYLQDAQGNLVLSFDMAKERGSGVLIATDLDRNGRTDLALAHSGWGYIGYYLQTDTGFAPETVVNAYQFMGRVNYFAAGDLNHDGCGDLVISRWSQSPVLLYGQGCSLPRIAICNLPPMRSGASAFAAASVSPSTGEQESDLSASATEGLTRVDGTPGRTGKMPRVTLRSSSRPRTKSLAPYQPFSVSEEP
ncbi:MAG: hypothetical protein EOO23_03610 [Comamonadaceae bacterium]|nr:MAG: hypothetical protein EOO23_03610 [Comamonadaceae bacterium]